MWVEGGGALIGGRGGMRRRRTALLKNAVFAVLEGAYGRDTKFGSEGALTTAAFKCKGAKRLLRGGGEGRGGEEGARGSPEERRFCRPRGCLRGGPRVRLGRLGHGGRRRAGRHLRGRGTGREGGNGGGGGMNRGSAAVQKTPSLPSSKALQG